MIAGRIIDVLDRSLHRASDCCEQHRNERWHSSNALMNVFQYALILSLIQSSVDERPTLCYPLSVDTKYILLMNDEQLG